MDGEVSGTSVWVIVGVVGGVGVIGVFVLAVVGWLLKLIIERVIRSLDENTQSNSKLSQEMSLQKMSVKADFEKVHTEIKHVKELQSVGFERVHGRLDSGSKFHDEVKEGMATLARGEARMRQDIRELQVKSGVRSAKRTTSKVIKPGNDS